MKKRIKITENTPVPVHLSARARELIEEVLPGSPSVKQFSLALPGKDFTANYTLYDIEEIMGFVAVEANHTTNRKRQRELDNLRVFLDGEMQKYDDGNW